MHASSTSHRTVRTAAVLVPLAIAATPLASLAAGLPTMEDPSRGTGSGIMQTLQNYGYDIVLLIALLVVASMFVGVCYHAYTRNNWDKKYARQFLFYDGRFPRGFIDRLEIDGRNKRALVGDPFGIDRDTL